MSGERSLVTPRTPSHMRNHTPSHVAGGGGTNSRTPTHDVSNYCTLNRKNKKGGAAKKKTLDKRHSGSHDDLFTGTMVSKVPESEVHVVMQPSAVHWTEIDLDLAAAQRSVQELQLGEDKPMLSSKAQARIARRNRSPTGREGLVVAAAAHPMSSLATSTLVAGPQDFEYCESSYANPAGRSLRDSKSSSPTPSHRVARTASRSTALPVIEVVDEEVDNRSSMPNLIAAMTKPRSTLVASRTAPTNASSPLTVGAMAEGRFLGDVNEERTRHSIRSIDSGLGESDDPTQVDKEGGTDGASSYMMPASLPQPVFRHPPSSLSKLKLPKAGFSSLRISSKRQRKSMLLSELCVLTVFVPAHVTLTQRGRGGQLKFRFSPYTRIEYLRLAILKQFHEKFSIGIQNLAKLHLCRYLEDEEGWEWLEEDQNLHQYNLPSECKLELKPLEPAYQDVRVVIPQLEASMSVEYDQFSTVGDVLHQVLSLSEPPLENTNDYSLYHVRLRMHMDSSDSMVYYEILPNDILECRLSVGRLHSVIVTIKIPSIHSCRKVKVSLDETVGELISTLMRRVPDPENSRWNHMALLLHPGSPTAQGIWMEDYKFLAAYKLKPTDVIDFRPKYRPMLFELRVFPHDHFPNTDQTYATPELLVAQDTTISEVIKLLCTSGSLEYDPRFYGLYFHDDTPLPLEAPMWDHLDEVHSQGYQDSLVLHMIHKPLKVSFNKDEDSMGTVNVDFSQPAKYLHGILCRRYGVRYHSQCVLQYEGIALDLGKSLHNQGIMEQEHIQLMFDPVVSPDDVVLQLSENACTEGAITRSESVGSEEIDMRRLSMAPDNECNVWDVGEDSGTNIRVDPKKGVVAATFNKLVEKITSEKDHDLEFVKTFLYTYQSFATPERLLRKLVERYNVVRPGGMSLKGFAVMKQTIQVRVINALKLWVDLSVDFKDNSRFQDIVLNFINTVLVLDYPRLCKPIRTNILVIKGVIHKKNLKMFRDPPPPVKIPSHVTPLLTIFDFDPEEVARQMTIIDFSLFAKIKPSELLNQAWQKTKYKHRAQNILRLVDRMNNLTLWVATTILSQKDIQSRAKRISDFVSISQHLLEMHNLCTLMSLLNGLAHPSITRLKKSFAKLDKATIRRLDALQTLARPGDNFKMLRDELKRASNPCIPYLGLYMSDLTFMDNGNPNFHQDGLINFSKCRLIYSQIRDLILRQDKPYNFEEVPALHESITKFHFLDTDILYDVSLQREPRDKPK